jgi:hypothetical protein
MELLQSEMGSVGTREQVPVLLIIIIFTSIVIFFIGFIIASLLLFFHWCSKHACALMILVHSWKIKAS